MRILALETSGSSGSVAALEASRLVLEQSLASGSRSAQSLAPGIDALLAEVGWSVGQLELIAVTQGPGSFTGLRIGVTTAKALAYAGGAQLIGVNTLEVIARQAPAPGRAPATPSALWTVLDAQRGELFAARFTAGTDTAGTVAAGPVDRWSMQGAVEVIDRQEWLAQLEAEEAVSGPAVQRSAAEMPPGVAVIDRQFWLPRAETVGRLGYEQFLAGRRDDLFQLCPHYFRRAAAEEQWQRQHGPAG